MNGKFCVVKAFVILLIVFSLSCSKGGNKVKLGILPAIDSLPLIVAETEGLFEDEGLDIEIVMFASALEKEAAFLSSALHGVFGDPVTALLALKSPLDTGIFTESSRSGKNRMFGLVASPGSNARSFESVKRGQIAIASGTVVDFFLDEISLFNNFNPEKLQKLEVKGIPLRYQMLMSGQVEFAMLPEPLVSKAERDGARVIADDLSLDITATVISFRRDLLEKNENFAKSFTRAYNKSVNLINTYPDKYRNLMVARLRLPEELKEDFAITVYSEVRVPSEKDITRVYSWMKKKGILEVPLKYEKTIWKQ
ncbi:MAG: ABC transporter substrate-binding protein [Spirochaetota bacterium]